MDMNETATPLTQDGQIVTYIDENGCGVTYFKLKPEEMWGADFTKECGLLGEEIDKNFYFLRGYDIKSVDYDEEGNLIINRVNPLFKPLKVNLTKDTQCVYGFEYDKKSGVLTVTGPDGKKTAIDGFYVEKEPARLALDGTLKGEGTIYNPLGLSEIERTGMYAPAKEYFDISADNKMPEGKGAGYRIVTKESVNDFGLLYPFGAVEKLTSMLEAMGSQWRVPTKEDMDELLDAMEPEDEGKNHSGATRGTYGQFAGMAMKSPDMWLDFVDPIDGATNGQDIAHLNVLPVGMVPFRNVIMQDEDHDAEGFGKLASIWTNTADDSGNAYAKTFAYNSTRVLQEVADPQSMRSIRLCKEYTLDNFHEVENILGTAYPCELVYSPYCDNKYAKIWTKINLGLTNSELSGVTSDEWAAALEQYGIERSAFYINEWDGIKWVKKQMNDGDSVVIINCDKDGVDAEYHEWRVQKNDLVDTLHEANLELGAATAKIALLETELNNLKNTLDVTVRQIIESAVVINGVDKETSVVKTPLNDDGKITYTVGFADDAIFG